jgi:hypothetical protein
MQIHSYSNFFSLSANNIFFYTTNCHIVGFYAGIKTFFFHCIFLKLIFISLNIFQFFFGKLDAHYQPKSFLKTQKVLELMIRAVKKKKQQKNILGILTVSIQSVVFVSKSIKAAE